MRLYVCFIGLWMMEAGLAAGVAASTSGCAGLDETADLRGETPQSVWNATAAEDFAGATPTTDALWQKADSLLKQIYHGPVERSRQHHRAFGLALEDLVRRDPRPAAYEWEQLEGLMYFKSADGRLQMINWSVPNINGSSSYGGLVWVKRPTAGGSATEAEGHALPTNGKDASQTDGWTDTGAPDSTAYLYYSLQDFSSYQPYPEALTLTPAQWWGAYYYQAIEHTQADTLRLTLIGVNHSQSRYAQKVIEVLQLLPDGQIVFGAPIFRREAWPQSVPPAAKGGGRPGGSVSPAAHGAQEAAYPNAYIGYKPQGAGDADEAASYAPASRRNAGVRQTPAMRRVIFRYNPRTDLILRYDYQTYRRYRGAKAKETAAYMIVCDRLMLDPLSLDQTAARLVPAGGVYDAYIFEAPYWYPVEDVIARNPDPERGARHR